GMDFAAACDFRLATAESVFAHPGTKLGIITGFGGTQAVPRIMKPAASAEFFYTGKMFRAEEMKRGGFLTECFSSVSGYGFLCLAPEFENCGRRTESFSAA
ncbi:MAG: enoyl-CoA hydratase/isomerase family protein, partial [Geovibrio sp.]|nr:enoyl-CoA hydratase/isomerase family protein [Geovibrio sp.]